MIQVVYAHLNKFELLFYGVCAVCVYVGHTLLEEFLEKNLSTFSGEQIEFWFDRNVYMVCVMP